jgi:hypothetical protein
VLGGHDLLFDGQALADTLEQRLHHNRGDLRVLVSKVREDIVLDANDAAFEEFIGAGVREHLVGLRRWHGVLEQVREREHGHEYGLGDVQVHEFEVLPLDAAFDG